MPINRYRLTVANALLMDQVARIENPCVWIVTNFLRKLRICSHFGQLCGLREPFKTRAIPSAGAWLSLVERLLWEQDVGGSNPLAPTISGTPFGKAFSG